MPFYLKRWHLLISLAIFSLFFFSQQLKAAENNVTVIAASDDFKRLRVEPSAMTEFSSESHSNTEPAEVVVVETLQGAIDSGLPSWVVEEIALDAGYGNIKTLSEDQLSQQIETQIIDITAVESLPKISSGEMQAACSDSYWSDRDKTFSKQIDFSVGKNVYEDNGFYGELSGNLNGDGDVTTTIRYQVKKKCGLIYKVRFVYADIFVNTDVNAELGLEGTVGYKLEKDLFKKQLELVELNLGYWVSIVQFNFEFKLGAELGAKLLAQLESSLATSHSLEGSLNLAWHCTKFDCKKTRSDNTLQFDLKDQDTRASTEARLVITPYVDLHFSTAFQLYSFYDLAKGTVGVIADVPITFWDYYGNMCSDANDDGENEFVSGTVLDVTARLYAYLRVEVFGDQWVHDIDLNLGFWRKRVLSDAELPLNHRMNFSVYSKNLIFRELSSGNIFEPVIDTQSNLNLSDGSWIGPRSCFPFSDKVKYEVDWGESAGENQFLTLEGTQYTDHQWSEFGRYFIRARMVSDESGREFASDWVEKEVFVTPDGQSPLTLMALLVL